MSDTESPPIPCPACGSSECRAISGRGGWTLCDSCAWAFADDPARKIAALTAENDRLRAKADGCRCTLPEWKARRVVLAVMGWEMFRFVAEATEAVAKGRDAQDDFGFTPDEIRTAKSDRKLITNRYRALMPKMTIYQAEITARIEFLSGLQVGPGDEGANRS